MSSTFIEKDGTLLPPPQSSGVVEALQWLADISHIAGPPESIDLAATDKHIIVVLPTVQAMSTWIMATQSGPPKQINDALGTWYVADTMDDLTWSISLRTVAIR